MSISAKLCEAAFDGDLGAVISLLESGAHIDLPDSGWNPLHSAIENEHPEVVKLLLERGADIEYVNIHSGMTPLAHAVELECDAATQAQRNFDTCSLNLIEMLLEAGCDPQPGLAVAEELRNDHIKEFILNHNKKRNKPRMASR